MRALILWSAVALWMISCVQPAAAQFSPVGVQGRPPVCNHAELHTPGECAEPAPGAFATITDGDPGDADMCAAAGTGGGNTQVTCRYHAPSEDWQELGEGGGGGAGTNLGTTVDAANDEITITSDTGSDAVIESATPTTPGGMSNEDKAKLDGIETGATADQTDAEILSAWETESGRDAVADGSKLDGIEAGAQADQSASEVSFASGISDFVASNVRSALDQVWELVGRENACWTGFVRGGGWNPATNRYHTFVCLTYGWTSEIGGDSSSEAAWLTTPTTVGGNAYKVTCAGRFDPIPQCRRAGDVHQLNAMSDWIVGQEMAAIGADLIVTPLPGESHTYYHHGMHGTDAAGNANGIPSARHPRQFVAPRAFAVYGNRRLVIHPFDPDPTDDRSEGVYVLMDHGHNNVAADPAAVAFGDSTPNTPRRQMNFGVDADGTAGCSASGCPVNPNGANLLPLSHWGRKASLLADSESDPDALCLDNAEATSGICEDDHRYSCVDDAACSGFGLSASCIGYADALSAEIARQRHSVPALIDYIQDDGTGSRIGALAYVESVSATSCQTTGLEIEIAGWPFVDHEINFATSSGRLAIIDPEVYFGRRMGVDGLVSIPGMSRLYGDVAEDVPAGSSIDTSKEDFVVVINDDDGSCSSTGDALDGGGSTFSECKWSGSAWSLADCDGDDAALSGCEDTGTAWTMMAGEEYHVKNAVAAYYAGDDTNPVIDGNGRHAGRGYIEQPFFYRNGRRLTDASQWPIIGGSSVQNVMTADQLFSLGFVPWALIRDHKFKDNVARNLVNTGHGMHSIVQDLELIGNLCIRGCIATNENRISTTIDGIRGHGNRGHILTIDLLDDRTYRAYSARNVAVTTHKSFLRGSGWLAETGDNGSNAKTPAGVMIHDSRGSFGSEADLSNATFDFESIHIDGEEPFSTVVFEGGVGNDPETRTIIAGKERASFRDLSCRNLAGGDCSTISVIEQGASGPGNNYAVQYASQDSITDATYLPRWEGTWANGVRLPDNLVPTVDGVFPVATLGRANALSDVDEESGDSRTLTAAEMRGQSYYFTSTSAVNVTLPEVAAGLVGCFYDLDGTAGITLTPDSADVIVLDGVDLDAGDTVDSPGARGDFLCLEGLDATHWITKGRSGTWVDGGAP